LITGFAGSVLSTAVPVTDCIGAAAAAQEASTKLDGFVSGYAHTSFASNTTTPVCQFTESTAPHQAHV